MCVVTNFELADQKLDSVFRIVLEDLSYLHAENDSDTSEALPAVRNAMMRSQESWLKYRDDFAATIGRLLEGGSASNAEAWKVRTALTLDRIRELKTLQKFSYGRGQFVPNWAIGD
jgi:uncharacterized protein YecT (DUF1311 family)